ncbi:MAG: ParB/RepB/Spo0J family partition protein, partial [Geminicoccaceae bacterium]
FGHTQEALAGALGKSRSHIANLLRLLGLPPSVRQMLDDGELSAGHARALLAARDPESFSRAVVSKGLNVRQTEALVQAENRTPGRRAAKRKDANTLALERELSSRLGLVVTISAKRTGGALCVAYRSLDQLDDLIRRLS